MTDILKTTCFLGVAVAAALLAWSYAPQETVIETNALVGKEMFPKFSDPTLANSLEVIRFDEAAEKRVPFKVTQLDGQWVIATNENYPADAAEQVREASNALVGLEILAVKTESPDQHQLLGVLEPTDDNIRASADGIGVHVKVDDATDSPLADLIVGKPVEGEPGQRYVRRPNQDPVYIVRLDMSKLPTDFESWIDRYLLTFDPQLLEAVKIADYTYFPETKEDPEPIKQNSRMTMNHIDDKWALASFQIANKEGWTEGKLTEGEELDTAALDKMLQSVLSMEIGSVDAKPGSIGDAFQSPVEFNQMRLRFMDLMKKAEAQQPITQQEQALAQQVQEVAKLGKRVGYELNMDPQVRDTSQMLLSHNGELILVMEGGYEIVLYFGNEFVDETADSTKLNRYVFLWARLDPAKHPEPEYEAVPELPAEDSGQDRVRLQAQIKLIEKRNAEKRAEYEQQLRGAETVVRDLNNKFANWFYVISEDTYKLIDLGRDQLVRKKNTEPAM